MQLLTGNKHLCKFILCDIKELYTSIPGNLLKTPLYFCQSTYTHQMMTKQLFNTQKNDYSLTISKHRIRRDSGLFDVAMGASDGIKSMQEKEQKLNRIRKN